jgi:hypothetical protein
MALKAKKERRDESLSFYLKQYDKKIDVYMHNKIGNVFHVNESRKFEIDIDEQYILNRDLIEPIW